jgi:hypothetical protein
MAISPQIVLFVLLMLAVVQATKLDDRRQRRRARIAKQSEGIRPRGPVAPDKA